MIFKVIQGRRHLTVTLFNRSHIASC